MESKKVKRFIYEGLGFPLVLIDVFLVKKRDVWTPAIDYNKLQKEALLALAHKPNALTGAEVHFIRTYFEMTLENFGKNLGITHAAVLNWEKAGQKPAKMNPTTELCIRLFILEKLNMSNKIFRETFREFDIQTIAKTFKTSATKAKKPVKLSGANIRRRSNVQV